MFLNSPLAAPRHSSRGHDETALRSLTSSSPSFPPSQSLGVYNHPWHRVLGPPIDTISARHEPPPLSHRCDSVTCAVDDAASRARTASMYARYDVDERAVLEEVARSQMAPSRSVSTREAAAHRPGRRVGSPLLRDGRSNSLPSNPSAPSEGLERSGYRLGGAIPVCGGGAEWEPAHGGGRDTPSTALRTYYLQCPSCEAADETYYPPAARRDGAMAEREAKGSPWTPNGALVGPNRVCPPPAVSRTMWNQSMLLPSRPQPRDLLGEVVSGRSPSHPERRYAHLMEDENLPEPYHTRGEALDVDEGEEDLPSLSDLLEGRVSLTGKRESRARMNSSAVSVAANFLSLTRHVPLRDTIDSSMDFTIVSNPAALQQHAFHQHTRAASTRVGLEVWSSVDVSRRPVLEAVRHAPGVFIAEMFYDPFYSMRWWEKGLCREEVLRCGHVASGPPADDGAPRYVDCFGLVTYGPVVVHPMRQFMVELFLEKELTSKDEDVRNMDLTLAENIHDIWALERQLVKRYKPRQTRPLSSIYNVVYPSGSKVRFVPTNFTVEPISVKEENGEKSRKKKRSKEKSKKDTDHPDGGATKSKSSSKNKEDKKEKKDKKKKRDEDKSASEKESKKKSSSKDKEKKEERKSK